MEPKTEEILTSSHDVPMIEDTLGEGLTGGVLTEISVETEGLGDREVSLDGEHGCSDPLLLAEDLSTTLVQTTVDTTNGVFGTLDFDYGNRGTSVDYTRREGGGAYRGR